MKEFISGINLTKTYTNGNAYVKALDKVSISLKRGEVVAIVGESGSGKSTLLNVLGGLLQPSSGKVYINGISICDLSESELSEFRRDNIGFVFQDYNLLPMINAYENILLPIKLGGYGIDEEYINTIVDALGIKEQLFQMPQTLSGGQKQRVGIARALASKPALILADEPTGNLDSTMSTEVIRLMRMLAEKFEQTMIIITHDERIASYGDKILRMSDGKLTRAEYERA